MDTFQSLGVRASMSFLLLSSVAPLKLVPNRFTLKMDGRMAAVRKTLMSTLDSDQRESFGRGRLIAQFDGGDFSSSWPYSEKDLSRADSNDDAFFYMQPRFVTHIDNQAIAAVMDFYGTVIKELKSNGVKEPRILDMCSSWISHLPRDMEFGSVLGIGMNSQELGRNDQLTEWRVQNLNENPLLDLPDESIDLIVNSVSVDYLSRPLEIFQEMHRVLAPNGFAVMSFSNRCFPTKVVDMWLRSDDIGRIAIVGSYFHFSSPSWEYIKAFDLRPGESEDGSDPPKGPGGMLGRLASLTGLPGFGGGDPMYAVVGKKKE